MHESLFETFTTSKSKPFHLARGNQRVIAKDIMNVSVSLKSKAHDASVSNIIFHTDNQPDNLKAIDANNHLADFCKEIDFYKDFCKEWIDNSKRVKVQRLDSNRFFLNEKGSQVPSDAYFKGIVKIFK